MSLAQILSDTPDYQLRYFFKDDSGHYLVCQANGDLLFLKDDVIQSGCQLQPPYRPSLPHCYVMLLPLLVDSEPKSILELGAGALSLQRYLRFSHPEIMVHSVESNTIILEHVIEHFPHNDAMHVIEGDAHEVCESLLAKNSRYDWVLFDLFDGDASPFQNNNVDWLTLTANLVAENGWLVVNLIEPDKKDVEIALHRLATVRTYTALLLPVPELKNQILLIKCDQQHFPLPKNISESNLLG